MTTQSEDLPPPYVPPGAVTAVKAADAARAVSRWIVIYAMAGKPLGWFLQRIANGVELFDEYGKGDFHFVLLAFAVWCSLSLLVTALVHAGGAHAWLKPTHRPRLPRTGFGCSIDLNVLLTGIATLLIGAALATPQQPENNQFCGPTAIAGVIAIPISVACFAVECVAWRWLRRPHCFEIALVKN